MPCIWQEMWKMGQAQLYAEVPGAVQLAQMKTKLYTHKNLASKW